MLVNPGGQIPPEQVIGRARLIRRLWRILERQSLVLSSERRMGKTCVIKKMEAEPLANKLCIYRDLEGINTSVDFVQLVFNDVEEYLSRFNRTMQRGRAFLTQLRGIEVGGVLKLPPLEAQQWKSLLAQIAEDLAENQQETAVFFWDEMPLMLYNIARNEGEEAAMELLDALRSIRQHHASIRMVFTGSIGLHNIITDLKRSGYANDPTNDMHTEIVPPLRAEDARQLARCLLESERIQLANPDQVADAIVRDVDGIPYFIHHVVDQLASRDDPIDAEAVAAVITHCLGDSSDPWHLRYYRERIDTYYPGEYRPYALHLLDILAVAQTSLAFDELFNLLKARLVTEDAEMARDMLVQLQRDHYITQMDEGAYHFNFPIIQRSWRLQRGLR